MKNDKESQKTTLVERINIYLDLLYYENKASIVTGTLVSKVLFVAKGITQLIIGMVMLFVPLSSNILFAASLTDPILFDKFTKIAAAVSDVTQWSKGIVSSYFKSQAEGLELRKKTLIPILKNILKIEQEENVKLAFFALFCVIGLFTCRLFNSDIQERININMVAKYKSNILDVDQACNISKMELTVLRILAYGLRYYVFEFFFITSSVCLSVLFHEGNTSEKIVFGIVRLFAGLIIATISISIQVMQQVPYTFSLLYSKDFSAFLSVYSFIGQYAPEGIINFFITQHLFELLVPRLLVVYNFPRNDPFAVSAKSFSGYYVSRISLYLSAGYDKIINKIAVSLSPFYGKNNPKSFEKLFREKEKSVRMSVGGLSQVFLHFNDSIGKYKSSLDSMTIYAVKCLFAGYGENNVGKTYATMMFSAPFFGVAFFIDQLLNSKQYNSIGGKLLFFLLIAITALLTPAIISEIYLYKMLFISILNTNGSILGTTVMFSGIALLSLIAYYFTVKLIQRRVDNKYYAIGFNIDSNR